MKTHSRKFYLFTAILTLSVVFSSLILTTIILSLNNFNADPRNEAAIAAPSMTTSIEEISLGSQNTKDFFIQSFKGNMPCGNLTSEWYIGTAKADQEFCTSIKNKVEPNAAECGGASMAYINTNNSLCYWASDKRVRQRLTTSTFKNKGCTVHATPESLAFPGGYDNKFGPLFNPTETYQNPLNTKFNLGELNSLHIETTVAIESYTFGDCAGQPLDPYYPNIPNMQFNVSVFVNEIDPLTGLGLGTYIYQVSFWHSDDTYRSNKNQIAYADCKLPAGNTTWASTGSNISAYGQDSLIPGKGPKTYKFDILPSLKAIIKRCNPKFDERNDLGRYKISTIFHTIEGSNTANIVVSTTNPKYIFNKKNSAISWLYPSTGPTQCNSIRGFAFDPKQPNASSIIHVYLADDINKKNFRFYTSTTANQLDGFLAQKLPNNPKHGFNFPIPYDLRDGVERYLYFYILNLNGDNPLIASTPIKVKCNYLAGNITSHPSNQVIPNCKTFEGWAGNSRLLNKAVDLHVYVADVPNGQQRFVTTVNANLTTLNTSSVLFDQVGHSFKYTPTNEYNDGKTRYFYLYALDTTGGQNQQLASSPVKYQCKR